jgi:hypothetical protein
MKKPKEHYTKHPKHKTNNTQNKKTLHQFKINLGIKNAYLNSVLILRFYLQTIHKTKNTKKIIIIKIKKIQR